MEEELKEYKSRIKDLREYMRSVDFYLLDRENQQCYKNMLKGLALCYRSAKKILEISNENK